LHIDHELDLFGLQGPHEEQASEQEATEMTHVDVHSDV
jgi:hypothetical protein